MIHQPRHSFFVGLFITILAMVSLALPATTWAQRARNNAHVAPVQQPLYTEYRGVRIGMKTEDVRAKLGEPLQKSDEMDFYSFSETEMVQIAYDRSHLVVTVSVDYIGAVGAPDYKSVVGPDVEVKPNGAIYKLVRYDAMNLWVYYNRTGGDVPIVTITLQKGLGTR